MRSDMGRVVIERPRKGSSNPSLKIKRVGRIHADEDGYDYDGPARVPNSGSRMKAINRKLGEKDFTDLLGPIHGYLTSSIGRRWDDVHSEIARNLGAFSWPLQHIMRQHIDVETNTYLGVDGRIYAENGNIEVGEVSSWFRRNEFYVHPITRLLCAAKVVRHASTRGKDSRLQTCRVKIDETRWFVFIRGNWFIGTYRKTDIMCVGQATRYHTEYSKLEWPDYQVRHGADAGAYIFRVIKQASKKEIRLLRELQHRVGNIRSRR